MNYKTWNVKTVEENASMQETPRCVVGNKSEVRYYSRRKRLNWEGMGKLHLSDGAIE